MRDQCEPGDEASILSASRIRKLRSGPGGRVLGDCTGAIDLPPGRGLPAHSSEAGRALIAEVMHSCVALKTGQLGRQRNTTIRRIRAEQPGRIWDVQLV